MSGSHGRDADKGGVTLLSADASRDGGMRWLAWFLAGPTVWAVAFSAAYGLHGIGCALGWPGLYLGPLSLQRAAIMLTWLVGIGACLALLWRLKRLALGEERIVRLALWTGLVATMFSLAPVLVASTC